MSRRPFRVEGFSTLRLSVLDVARSRDWYEKFFGVAPVEDLPDFASFRIAETVLELVLADEKSPISNGGSVGYWLVDDLAGTLSLAEELGAEIYRGPLAVEEIHRTIVQIRDPFGNVLGFTEVFK